MLDSDLAELYGVETKRLNEQVKRNREQFPDEFCFQLTDEGAKPLRSQIATLNLGRGEFSKNLPYAFTEQCFDSQLLDKANQKGPLVKEEFLPYCYNSIPAKPLSTAMSRCSNVAGFFLPTRSAP